MGLGSPEGPACQRTARQCGRAHASPMPDDQGSSETATTSPFLYHWLQAPFFFAPLMSITYAQLNKAPGKVLAGGHMQISNWFGTTERMGALRKLVGVCVVWAALCVQASAQVFT